MEDVGTADNAHNVSCSVAVTAREVFTAGWRAKWGGGQQQSAATFAELWACL